MGRLTVFILIFVALFGATLWAVSHITVPKFSVHTPSVLSASALESATPPSSSNSPAFDETGTIVLDQSEGSNGVPYILYTSYSESGKASIATKRLVFGDEKGCQASALPCATRPPSFPVTPGQQVRIVGTVEAQNVFVSQMQVLSPPAGPQGD